MSSCWQLQSSSWAARRAGGHRQRRSTPPGWRATSGRRSAWAAAARRRRPPQRPPPRSAQHLLSLPCCQCMERVPLQMLGCQVPDCKAALTRLLGDWALHGSEQPDNCYHVWRSKQEGQSTIYIIHANLRHTNLLRLRRQQRRRRRLRRRRAWWSGWGWRPGARAPTSAPASAPASPPTRPAAPPRPWCAPCLPCPSSSLDCHKVLWPRPSLQLDLLSTVPRDVLTGRSVKSFFHPTVGF